MRPSIHPSSARRPARLPCALAAAVSILGPASAETLVVPDDHATIQAAIDAAEPADTIIVEPGTYTENLELVSNIDVRGRETARTLLAPEDGSVATVSMTNVSGARFSNFTLIDSAVGVAVSGGSGIEIANVVFDGVADTGLSADGLSSVDVTNNVFFENGTAISRGSSNVQIENNIFSGNGSILGTALQPGGDPQANVASNCFFANDDDTDGAGLGVGATTGDPLFVDPDGRDFHLRQDSPCIDAGRGTDVIDSSLADAGAYGGPFADPFPFPVAAPELTSESTEDPPSVDIVVEWQRNLAYRVTNDAVPGGYRVYYKQGGDPGPPFEGTDAGGGTMPSPIDAGDVASFTLEDLAPQGGETPLAPRLLSAEPRNQAVVLTWEPAAGATGYRVLYGIDAVDQNVAEAGDATSFTLTGLTNDVEYRIAVVAVNQPAYHVAVTAVDNTQNRNESALSEVATIAVGTALESPLSNELTATPDETEAYPDLPDEGCFIATAAFGADWTREVRLLRSFRDRALLPTAAGRWLVRQYYAVGPYGARWLDEHASLKPLVRAALMPTVLYAAWWLASPVAASILLAATLVALLAMTAVTFVPALRRSIGLSVAARRRSLRPLGPSSRQAAAIAVGAIVAAALFQSPVAHSQPSSAQPSSPRPVPAPSMPAGTDAQAENARQPRTSSPRWMYELKGGYYYPSLERFEEFYDDERDTLLSVAGSYRLRDWLEVGGEIGHMRERGVGFTSGGAAGGDVRLRLMPVQIFANFIWQREDRRFVPYAGLAVSSIWYEEDIELQPGSDGHTDVGTALRLGLRWLVRSEGSHSMRNPDATYWRSFVFIEAQSIDAEIDDIDLGGESYQIGFRMEFELGR